jgi:regulatory protein
MQKITALKMQKRNRERVNVFLDGTFAFGLPLDTALHLKVGDELSAEKIADLKALDQLDKAKNSALRYLAARPRSSAEVQRNLQGKGYDDHEIDHVIGRLQELNLLDDAAFARYWVEQREQFKPRSHLMLRQELRQKGIADSTVESILETIDEEQSARTAAQSQARRWAHLDFDAFRQKLGGHLQRRGFSYGIIRDVVDEVWNSLHDAEEF